jgi:hypothetical protein
LPFLQEVVKKSEDGKFFLSRIKWILIFYIFLNNIAQESRKSSVNACASVFESLLLIRIKLNHFRSSNGDWNRFRSLPMLSRTLFDKKVIRIIFPFSSWTQTLPTFMWTPFLSDWSEDAVASLEEPLHWIQQSQWNDATTNRKNQWIFLIISWYSQDLISDSILYTQKNCPEIHRGIWVLPSWGNSLQIANGRFVAVLPEIQRQNSTRKNQTKARDCS